MHPTVVDGPPPRRGSFEPCVMVSRSTQLATYDLAVSNERLSAPREHWRVVGAFADGAAARSAAAALRAGGLPDAAITVAGGAADEAAPKREREERFLGRLVLIVVAWSVVGTAVGVVMGLVFNALSIGPGGAGGLGIQIASWAIFAHLIAGLWAGYALLTKGESREPVLHRADGRAVVSVSGAGDDARARVADVLRGAGAAAVALYDTEGRRT
jgi:hypothetical protein